MKEGASIHTDMSGAAMLRGDESGEGYVYEKPQNLLGGGEREEVDDHGGDVWDDSALMKAYNDAVERYKRAHNSAGGGGGGGRRAADVGTKVAGSSPGAAAADSARTTPGKAEGQVDIALTPR